MRSVLDAMPPEARRLAELVQPVAASESRIVGLYLFGSRATGEARDDSDVDLGVLFSRTSDVHVLDLIDLSQRFEDAIGLDVDLVDMSKASAFLALDIVRGERLYAADEDACDHFDLYVMRRAADLAPFERMRRAMSSQRVKDRKAS